MSKNRRKGPAANPFGSDTADETTDTSLEAVTNRGYGAPEILNADRRRVKVRLISIDEIFPDPQQPRRAIPSPLRPVWSQNPADLAEFFNVWIIQTSIDVERYLYGDDDDDYYLPQDPDMTEAALVSLLETAKSIKRDGLINPITVVRDRGGYRIETGERRWLAHHLLRVFEPDEAWDKIPARVETDFDVWRQASENNARESLNAVAKARQLALLLMDLYGFEKFRPFHDYAPDDEQAFYAQVEDGKKFPVPYGKSQDILNALGMTDPGQIRQYRAILRVPRDYWNYADDTNAAEGEIREAIKTDFRNVGKDIPKPERAPAWIRQIDRWSNPVTWRKMTGKERKEFHDRLLVLARQVEEFGFSDKK